MCSSGLIGSKMDLIHTMIGAVEDMMKRSVLFLCVTFIDMFVLFLWRIDIIFQIKKYGLDNKEA